MVNIAYYTNVRLPTERAHGHQIASVCHALTLLGHNVTLYSPYRKHSIEQNFCSYYSVSEKIRHVILGSFDFINRWWLPGPFCLWMMNFCLRRSIRSSFSSSFDVLYTRTPALLSALFSSDIPVILELHQLPRWFRTRFVKQCSQCALVVCLTRAMAEELCAWGVPREKVIVEGDAVDLSLFTEIDASIQSSFSSLFPQNVPLLMYTGQLSSMGLSKGVDVFLEACLLLRQQSIAFHAVIAGGPLATQQKLSDHFSPLLPSSLTFLGHVPHSSIPALLSLASVLIYPAPFSSHSYFLRDTSPLKVFEYMAAGKPIVAADLPPLHDITDDQMVFFSRAGDAEHLAKILSYVLTHQEEAQERARRATERVQRYTWTERMKRILSSFSYAHFQ